jgi:hypothetical protein
LVRRLGASTHNLVIAIKPEKSRTIYCNPCVFVPLPFDLVHGAAAIPENRSSNRARHAKR